MSDFEFLTRKSPCCDAECWDVDCDACETEGEDIYGDMCMDCNGAGYISGWFECSKCGEHVDENDLVYPEPPK